MNEQKSSSTPVSGSSAEAMDAGDLEELRNSVRQVCARDWPTAADAERAELGDIWAVAAQQGWLDLADNALLPAALAIQEELGRFACPLPIVDSALVAAILNDRDDTTLVERIADGTVRPVIAHVSSRDGGRIAVRNVEAATVATHLLAIDDEQLVISWYDLQGVEIVPLPGLAIPSWSEVRLFDSPEWTVERDAYPDLTLLRSVGLGARAAAAVRRTHELAVEHAGQREQFGRPIGSFQAVSHRLVNVEIALSAARQLLDHALSLLSAADASWQLAADIYLQFTTEHLARLQFDGHHTLAAVGYFDEHDAPWLFRRANADLSLLSVSRNSVSVGSQLIDHGATLPDFDRGEEAESIRRDVLEAFAPWTQGPPSHLSSWDDDARAVLRDRGWIGAGWPRELGGAGFDEATMMAFSEAIAYSDPPLGNIWMGINSIAPMLIEVGPPELRDLVMEEIHSGNLSIALGYSESEAGSDLASLRTRAEKVAGGWKINGHKLWGTCVPDSKWIMLAARTDPAAARPHAGISLFLVDLDSPGITVQDHRSLGGDVSSTTFWDNVFVPDSRVVGQVNQGWAALGSALSAERVLIGASVMKAHRTFGQLVDLVSRSPEKVLPSRRDQLRSEIGRVGVRLQAARALVNAAVAAMASGHGEHAEAPMAKIWATELVEDLNATAISLLGPDALYSYGTPGVIGNGRFEDGLRGSIMGVIAGGTGDIQRNLVARGMGLPR